LNLSNPEDNVNGFCAFESASFIFEDEMIDAVVLHKQILDVEDLKDKTSRLVVSLLECGTKILVEEPAVPHYYHTHVDQILQGIKHGEARRAIETAHICTMNSIMSNPDRHMKKYILNLPVGLKCKMGYMNPTAGRILVGSMNVASQQILNNKGVFLKFTMATVTYAIAIDTEDQKVVRKNPNVGNEVEDCLSRMS
jgi:hypothetical protein